MDAVSYTWDMLFTPACNAAINNPVLLCVNNGELFVNSDRVFKCITKFFESHVTDEHCLYL